MVQWWAWLIMAVLYVVLIVLLILGLSKKCPPPAPMDKFWVVDGWDKP